MQLKPFCSQDDGRLQGGGYTECYELGVVFDCHLHRSHVLQGQPALSGCLSIVSTIVGLSRVGNFSFCTVSILVKLVVAPGYTRAESFIFCLESKVTIRGVIKYACLLSAV